MHKAMTIVGRVAVGLAAVAAVIGLGAAPAQANEGPMYQEIKVTYDSTGLSLNPCGSEVWGVAAGDGTPESERGNYQVCRYAGSAVEVNLGAVSAELATRAKEAVWKAAGSPPATSLLSYCPYYMPTGPNRSATVTYRMKVFTVTVIDRFANGQSFVSATGAGYAKGQPIVSWTPSCASR